MEIKVVDSTGNEIKNDPQPFEQSKEGVSAPVLPQLEQKAISDVIGLSDSNEIDANRDKIDLLLQYAKSHTEDKSLEGLKWAIRSLELKLGTPPFTEKRIDYLHSYVYLLMEEEKIQKDKARFERNII